VTRGTEEVHAFAWSSDSQALYFATHDPCSKSEKDDYRKRWKGVIEYRTAERGDTIFVLDSATALANHAAPGEEQSEKEKESDLTKGTRHCGRRDLKTLKSMSSI
jgi:hypothetical protein